MDVGARRATAADVDGMAELAAAALAEQAGARGGTIWALREARAVPAHDSLRDDLGDERAIVLVGGVDGAVLGYAVARVEPLRDGSTLARLVDIVVEPLAREVGVGEALLDEVLAWAAAQGCRGLDALVLPGNRAAKNFFETAGLTARAIVVHRELG
jgi:ribosomal protein S18 acetylase RimI-like enzyme